MKAVSKRTAVRNSSIAVVAAALVATVSGIGGNTAEASSHREAPLTAGDPQHDNTDLYAFVSPNNHKAVTLIANWIPFEEPNGGPNFYPWATHTHYDINIDSDGDGRPNLIYRWQFHNVVKRQNANGGTFLYNNGPVTKLKDKNLLFRQRFSLTRISAGGATKVLVHNGPVAPSDTGAASMPHYGKLRHQAITNLQGAGKTVVTQSADPFFLDLRVFDLLYGGNLSEAGQDTLAGYNVNAIALQVPKKALALNHKAKRNPVIGIWSSTETQSLQLAPGTATRHGSYVQVSRLGMPLVNEVVVPTRLKDAFNGLPPAKDHTVKPVVNRVLHPEVPKLLQSIYGLKAPKGPRTDLAEIFLSGICKRKVCFGSPVHANLNSQVLNKDGRHGARFVPAEELRLNMSIPVTSQPNRLGVLGGDLQGFPNGRRLGDDVVDIELLALEGVARGHKIPPALMAGDGVNGMPSFSQTTPNFPYTPLPNHGGVNTH